MAKLRKDLTDSEAWKSLMRSLMRGDHLALSYWRSAHLVAEAELKAQPPRHHVDMPALYLIRHAVELALKDLLEAHHENELDRNRVDKATSKPMSGKPLTEKELDCIRTRHNLDELLVLTEQHMKNYVSPTWRLLVDAIVTIEGQHVEFSRFPRARLDQNAKRTGVPPWKYEFVRAEIPLAQLLAALDGFFKEAALMDIDAEPKEWSALQDLTAEGTLLAETLYDLGEL